MKCLQCGACDARENSKFCSDDCKAEFARGMCEAIECALCDAQADSINEAQDLGWEDIFPDPEGSSWNYLGFCPDCAKEK